jgi:hypothetical protein
MNRSVPGESGVALKVKRFFERRSRALSLAGIGWAFLRLALGVFCHNGWREHSAIFDQNPQKKESQKVKTAIRGIVGKTIESVIVSESNKEGPHKQIFLVFTDGTYYEIYGNMNGAAGIDPGGQAAALRYAQGGGGKITIHSADDNS